MKPYGKNGKQDDCCPGHDTFPSDKYGSKLSQKAHTRDTKKLHRQNRRKLKQDVKNEV